MSSARPLSFEKKSEDGGAPDDGTWDWNQTWFLFLYSSSEKFPTPSCRSGARQYGFGINIPSSSFSEEDVAFAKH